MKKSVVSVVKGRNRREIIYQALELIDDSVVPKILNNDIIIKPNCLSSYNPSSCTHVDALRGVLDFLSTCPTRSVTIAEVCRDSYHFESFTKLGYLSLPEEYNVSLSNPDESDDWVEMQIIDKLYKAVNIKVARSMVESKCRISLAVAKTHDTVIMTGAWKNMMGAISVDDKVKMHGVNSHRDRVLTSEIEILPQNLLRLAKLVPPHVSVIDGFIAMEGDGPVRGREKHLGVAIASLDFVSADAVCAKIMGFEPMEISYLYLGHKFGLGTADLNEIEIIGEPIESVSTRFVPHHTYETQSTWRKVLTKIPYQV